MKIGIDIRTLMDVQYSGVSEFTLNLINSIFKQDKINEYILFYNSGKDVSERIPEFDFPNVKIVNRRYPNKIFNYFLQKFLHWPKIDQLLGVDLFFMPHMNFIALNNNARKIITIHDLSFLKYPEFFSARKNIWHKMINIKKLLSKFDEIITVSQNTKDDIVDECQVDPKKIKVIYSGIDTKYKKITDELLLKKIKDKYKLPEKFIFYLGNVEPRKNIESLIIAFEKLKEKNEFNSLKLVIAGGTGWKTNKIISVWENSKVKEDIIFLGYIDNNDKPSLYSLASVFVYPSFYEGFGFPVLEAMACETPVITSHTSSLPEITGTAAITIDPYNTNEITQAIELIINNENLRKDIIKKGLEQASHFNWDKTALEYLKIFNN